MTILEIACGSFGEHFSSGICSWFKKKNNNNNAPHFTLIPGMIAGKDKHTLIHMWNISTQPKESSNPYSSMHWANTLQKHRSMLPTKYKGNPFWTWMCRPNNFPNFLALLMDPGQVSDLLWCVFISQWTIHPAMSLNGQFNGCGCPMDIDWHSTSVRPSVALWGHACRTTHRFFAHETVLIIYTVLIMYNKRNVT